MFIASIIGYAVDPPYNVDLKFQLPVFGVVNFRIN